MKRKKQVWKILRSVVMFGGIIALLGLYLLTVSNLPSRIYTESQQEFLAYNRARSIQQIAPTLNWEVANDKAMVTEGEAVGNEDIRQLLLLPWQSSRVKATLKARYEEKGGISVAVYDLIFEGVYGLKHTAEVSATIDMFFPFPSNLETLHDVAFVVDFLET